MPESQSERLRQFSLRLDRSGQGVVLLDDEDISYRVSCVDIHAPAGGPLRVTLTMVVFDLDVEIEADAEDVQIKEKRPDA